MENQRVRRYFTEMLHAFEYEVDVLGKEHAVVSKMTSLGWR